MRFGHLEDRRALSDMAQLQMNARLFYGFRGTQEERKLSSCVRLVSDVRHGEVRERALQLNVRQGGDVTRERRRFFARAADASHARVDGEVQLRRLFLREGFGGNGFGEREIRDGLRHIEGDGFGGFKRVDESEDEERRLSPRAAKLGGF